MLKKFFALALALVTIVFVGMAEAGIVTDRFPLFCYVDHQVDTYNQPNGQKVGYISANVDLIRVTQVRGDGWAYGDYPGRNGRVARWFRINELCADPGYSNRGTNIRGAQNVFRTKNGGDFIGSVSNNEEVIVLADNGNRAQILYKLNNNTGWKMGWVPSSTVSSRNVQPVVPSPIANTVTLAEGWYRIQPMHDLGRSADALGSQIGNGNNIHMWTNVEDALQQKFYLKNRGNGYFSLQSAYGSKLYVTADGRGPGANLYTSDWKNSDSQLFRLVNAGNNSYHVFAKVGVNLNFDCAGAGRGDGTNLQLWTSENNDWHKWRFTQVNVNVNSTPVNNISSSFDPIWPLANSHTITTLYRYSSGERHSSRYRYGIDMSAPEGENVLATESGTVIASYYSTTSGFGNMIKIKHDNGKVSLYAHLSARLVSNGRVSKGQVIGRVGHTSAKYKIGTHLHFELGNSDDNGADGDPWQEYFKTKYGNIVTLTQAAAKYPNP